MRYRIVIGSDHAGYKLKKCIIERLSDLIDFYDVGTFSEESVDYPIYASKVAELVSKGIYEYGILICGTGIGVCIVANKYPNVRAALVYSREVAALAKKHNNANIICLGGRFMTCSDVVEYIKIWLSERFEGGRHLRRINQIKDLEERICCRNSK